MTCQQASLVISRSIDTELNFGVLIGLRVHTLFCGPCRRYRRQLQMLHGICEQSLGGEISTTEDKLSADARMRIKAALDQVTPDT
jgi:hypothetical protein